MAGSLDLALVILFTVVWPVSEYFWLWPRHVRAVEAGDPGARSRVYLQTVLQQWALAGAVLALTAGFARPLQTLGLGPPHGWLFGVAAGLSIGYAILLVIQARQIAASPRTQARLRARVEGLRALIPHSPRELRWFVLLSVTAGVCEELLFRGYLVWALKPWIGLWGAALVSMVLFGLGHAYQGAKHGIRAFYAGVGLGLLAIGTGSILPGMVIHALIDLGSGWITHIAVRGGDPAEATAVGAA